MEAEILKFLKYEGKTVEELIIHLENKGFKAKGDRTLNFQNRIDKIIWLNISAELKQTLIRMAYEKKIVLEKVDSSLYKEKHDISKTEIYRIISEDYKGFLEWVPVIVKKGSNLEGLIVKKIF